MFVCAMGTMVFAKFGGALLLTIFDLVRVSCFAPWTISLLDNFLC